MDFANCSLSPLMSNSKTKDRLSINQGSVPWPHRFQVSEFPDKKAFVFVPRTPSVASSDAVRITRAFARAAGEQLGFEETSDLISAKLISLSHEKNFIIVGDGTKGTSRPNEETTRLILKHAKDHNNIPILPISILEVLNTLYQLLKEKGSPLQQRLREFLDFVPLRLVGTRWKVHMVLNRYLALAWEISGDTWKFVFREEDFIREYKGLFGDINPDDALRASVLAFIEDPDIYFS
ncbi:hypothetical protein BC937DRAFT_89406 [Endogone sp. FLAS-F59071]|nr:hypothetical protein BC937DRAFT_89406 [Endogone sp. FLAS-F59071]|eukprot:RUS22403.1 hypothetical protein BC937DRAFT_89406 [Endogone sp. FLAS-F59071]